MCDRSDIARRRWNVMIHGVRYFVGYRLARPAHGTVEHIIVKLVPIRQIPPFDRLFHVQLTPDESLISDRLPANPWAGSSKPQYGGNW
jgi:hypothetical protein